LRIKSRLKLRIKFQTKNPNCAVLSSADADQLIVYQSVDQPTAKPWPLVVLQIPIDVREFSTMHHGDLQGVFENQVTSQDLTECHFSLNIFRSGINYGAPKNES
jgi:hypothetical protein